MCVIFIYSPSIIWLALSRISDPHIFYWDLIVFMFLAITTVISFGGLYRQYGIKETASGTGTILPFDNLYFSVVTWTTVGYGDFIPASKTSKKLAAYEAITGYITMAALFSVGVAILSGRR
jgi:voltage-gated potassium channel Kch